MNDVVQIAERLADEFRGQASKYDQSGEFPFESYGRMREEGYLRAPVPEELGGLGAGIEEMTRAQQALARGCGSTAIAVNMHLFQVGTMADGWRNGGPDALLKRIAAEGIVIASLGAEAVVAGEFSPSATAERVESGYKLNGRKYFCSQAPGMDIVRTFARDVETGETKLFGFPANAPGVRWEATWDTTGMRASASHDLVLEDVMVPETALGATLPAGPPMRVPLLANVARWFHLLASGVYLGIAEEARAEAYKALGKGINSTLRDPALTDMLIGEMEAEFLTAQSVRDSVAARLATMPADPHEAVRLSTLCKEIVTARAVATVEKAVEIAGGRSFYRKSPLERLARDVRAGRFHPPAAPVSFQMAGERAREAAMKEAAPA